MKRWESLPDDLWEEIFGHIDRGNYRHLQPVSLVCKRFLALSNRARTTFTVPYICFCDSPAVIFTRFRYIRILYSGFDLHPGLFIAQLADSNLPLHTLHLCDHTHIAGDAMRLLGRRMSRTLRSLSCVRFQLMTDDDLSLIAASFPYLEELDLQGSGLIGRRHITDQGILAVSLKLKSLLSVNLCGQLYLSFLSFQYLSSNCPSITNFQARFPVDCPFGLDYIHRFKSLSFLLLEYAPVTNSALDQLSRANLKLTKLVLTSPENSGDITATTLCRFFKSCRHLRALQLRNFILPPDMTTYDFTASIPRLQCVSLDRTLLPQCTLFHLLKSCPDLEEIEIGYALLKELELEALPARCLLRKLHLLYCKGLTDRTLAVIASVCPKMESLHLTWCSHITKQGIEDVMARCNSIKSLRAERCKNVQEFVFKNGVTYASC